MRECNWVIQSVLTPQSIGYVQQLGTIVHGSGATAEKNEPRHRRTMSTEYIADDK